MNRIDGKIAVVTGGTQGLGAAIALQFAESGAAGVITCGRNREKGESVAAMIRAKTGCPVHFRQADLEKVADCRAVFDTLDSAFGRVDILANAAGITDRGDILTTDEALFDRMFAVNTRAPFFLMQEAIRRMVRDGTAGAVVNIGSTSELAGQPFISPYCASKAALATFTRNTAFAAMRNKIRVNALAPGYFSTELNADFLAGPQGQQMLSRVPMGRAGDYKELDGPLLLLASEAGSFMTGSVLVADGGHLLTLG